MTKGKSKFFKEGETFTIRLSQSSGANEEVLEWINKETKDRNRNKEVIEAIKLKIFFEKKFGDSISIETINALIYGLMNTTISEASITRDNKKICKKIHEDVIEDKNQETKETDIKKIITYSDVEVELYEDAYKEAKRNMTPGIRALKSLKRR